jgi:hypothetical protein
MPERINHAGRNANLTERIGEVIALFAVRTTQGSGVFRDAMKERASAPGGCWKLAKHPSPPGKGGPR